MFAVLALLLAVSPPSSACTECHNDESAKTMETNHPFAVSYEQAWAAKPDFFRPPSEAGDDLIDGKVECASCHVTHDVQTDTPYRLRTRDIVKLCTTCHVIQN
jgi:predicted CXXCH cytochrome family protein